MNASKKGMSAHQLHRMLGITYKSAWFMAMRIREAMRDESPSAMGGPTSPFRLTRPTTAQRQAARLAIAAAARKRLSWSALSIRRRARRAASM